MKKFLAFVLSLIFISGLSAYADGIENIGGDLWDNFGDQNFYQNQQAVTDEQFQEALDSKLKKKKKNKKFKGEAQHQSNETNEIKTTADEPNILCVPVNLAITPNNIIPTGHYEVVGEKRDGKPILKFYQAHYLIAEVPANETNDDFEQDSVNFVGIKDYKDNKIMVIYGSLDFNAFTIIKVAE